MRIWLIVIIIVSVLFSCRKADRNEDMDTSMGSDFADVENAMFEVFNCVNEACKSTNGIKSFITCANLTADTLGSPKNLIVDFGNSGCASPTGRSRNGKIIIYQNGAYSTVGSYSNIYFDSLYINGYNYAGNLKITTTSTGYQLRANDFKLIYPDTSAFIVLNGIHYLVQTSGGGTALSDDDTYNVSGTITMIGNKGGTHSCTVDTGNPLQFSGNCGYITGGKLEIQPTGLVTRPIDFGSGTCDNSFIISINGENQTISSGF